MVALGSCIFGAHAAFASDSPIAEIVWSAPPECPDREWLLTAVERLLGSQARKLVTVSVRGAVEMDAGAYRLELAWSADGIESSRSMTSASCEDLGRAAAIMLALAADPERTHAEAPLARSTVPGDSTAPQQADPAPAGEQMRHTPEERSSSPKPPRPDAVSTPSQVELGGSVPGSDTSEIATSLRAGGVFDAGSLPAGALGAVVGASVRGTRLTGQLDATAFVPQTATTTDGSGRFFLLVTSLRACWRLPLYSASFSPCALLEANALTAQGRGLRPNRAGIAIFPRMGVAVEIELGVSGPVGAFIGVQGSVAPWRPSFLIDDATLVHRPEPWGLRVGGGFSWQL